MQSYCSERELNLPSSSTSAYCQARQRIGIEDLQKIGEEVSEQIHKEVRQAQRWKGHEVRVIDGTGISMPDTEQNQRAFPQPGGAERGVRISRHASGGLFLFGQRGLAALCRDHLKKP